MIPHPSQESASFDSRRFESREANSDAPTPTVDEIEAHKWLPDPVKESKLGSRLAQVACVVLLALLAGAIVFMAQNRWPSSERVERCNDPNYHGMECKGIHGRSAERNYSN